MSSLWLCRDEQGRRYSVNWTGRCGGIKEYKLEMFSLFYAYLPGDVNVSNCKLKIPQNKWVMYA